MARALQRGDVGVVQGELRGARGGPAVDAQHGAGDEAGLVAGEPDDGGRATSAGLPARPSGLADTAAAYASVTGLTGLSTSTKPGATALTRMPRPASSTAHALVAISSAAFDVQ